MKKILLILLFFNISFQCFSHEKENELILNSSIENKEDVVYICGGDYAYAYHLTTECRGLNNCKGDVYYTTSYKAKYTYNRKPCCICIGGYGCKNDGNPYNSGGGEDQTNTMKLWRI
jgi:hypothetical protein